MNLDDVREILALMRDNGLSEFEIERDGLKLRLRKDSAGTVMAPLAAAAYTQNVAAPQAVAAAVGVWRSAMAWGMASAPKTPYWVRRCCFG